MARARKPASQQRPDARSEVFWVDHGRTVEAMSETQRGARVMRSTVHFTPKPWGDIFSYHSGSTRRRGEKLSEVEAEP